MRTVLFRELLMKTTTTLILPLLLLASLLTLPASAQENTDNSEFALDGTWVLKQQVILHEAEPFSSPFSGRTLSFSADGTFTEDYSTENHIDPELKAKIKVDGKSNGLWRVEKVASETGEGTTYRLLVRNEISKDNTPRVKYEGEVRKAGPSLPLGFGRTESFDDGRWAVCSVLIETNADGETTGFDISNGGDSKIVWCFGKEGVASEEGVLLSSND